MPRRTAIVADRRPLERGLARFLLEERGLFVVGEAATMADVLLQVQQLKPDLLVLHEKLAIDHDPTVVAQIRRISARTSLVLLAASRDALPPELILLTDAVVEDGPGLTGLGIAVGGAIPEIAATSGAEPEDTGAIAVVPPARRTGIRWASRLQGLAVAAIIALALVIARDMTTPTLVPTVVGRAHLVAAWDSLDELESALTDATTPEQVTEIASELIDERAAAQAAGISVTALDQALVETLATLWPSLPPGTQDLVIALFGGIIGEDKVSLPPPLPSPTPEPTPSPDPDPEPEPSPPPSVAPAPNEASVPPPTETTPPPTETTTPPDETTTTPPTETTTTPPPDETTTTPPTETTTTSPTETTTTSPTETTTTSPTETTTTSPTETTTTSPTETTTTSPTETTTTSPTETTTTSPTETTTTSPTETTTTTSPAETSTTTSPAETSTTTSPAETTTSPAETTTPPAETTTPPAETTTPLAVEGETRSWSLAVVPFSLTLLLAISGWARRRWRDTPVDPDGSDPP